MLADAQLSRSPPGLGLNRWDSDNPLTFAASVATAEQLGATCALLDTNPLRVFDPYVCLSLASLRAAIDVARPGRRGGQPDALSRPALDFARWFTEHVWPLVV
jgi:hypothetical protein